METERSYRELRKQLRPLIDASTHAACRLVLHLLGEAPLEKPLLDAFVRQLRTLLEAIDALPTR